MQNPQDTLNQLREQLNERGAKTIRSLGRIFRSMDSYDGNRQLDRQEFMNGLKELGLTITEKESFDLMKLLDQNQDGFIDFEEFLVGVRGKPNYRRQAMIDKAFLKFDKDGSGRIDVYDLKSTFNYQAHPKVQTREMNEEQVFIEFLQNFSDWKKDGTIPRDEWNDYYSAVSASVDNDDHFVQLMRIAWRLD